MKHIRVLLAHRDRALIKNLHAAIQHSHDLEWAGHATTEAELLRACHDAAPDLLLLDTHLDDVPSHTVIAAVKNLARPPKIVGFAASADPATIRAMLRAGASGYLLTTEPLRDTLAVLPMVCSNKIVLSSSLVASLPE